VLRICSIHIGMNIIKALLYSHVDLWFNLPVWSGMLLLHESSERVESRLIIPSPHSIFLMDAWLVHGRHSCGLYCTTTHYWRALNPVTSGKRQSRGTFRIIKLLVREGQWILSRLDEILECSLVDYERAALHCRSQHAIRCFEQLRCVIKASFRTMRYVTEIF
jgi:hypothetical protein